MLQSYLHKDKIEAGCDEAGLGCLAGPVYAGAVILPPSFECESLNDSKQLSPRVRYELRRLIEREALSWGIGIASVEEVDRVNILNARFLAMHRAIENLKIKPEYLLIDGNRFAPYGEIPYECIVKGDAKFMSIAAASILAKTYRDDFMNKIHKEFPQYAWEKNKGYPTTKHREAIKNFGITPYHRTSFTLLPIEENTLF
ncbi:MAG TPA: ribonuclease HII [Porphyromonadaceae bacterium]|nr:ribonuclease HII [Porphyromonadaceae bacterium]